MNLDILDFEESTIKFEATKLLNTRAIWTNSEHIFSKKLISKNLNPNSTLIEQFSYVIGTSDHFRKMQFDQNDVVNMIGERYGGGVRCGNIGQYQIKGIGTNCLVGKNVDTSHSYGGLDLHGAILEVIYTNALNIVLPIGAVDIVGLLLTGLDSGLIEGKKVPGALFVRDTCIRPAHFLPCFSFEPEDSVKMSMLSARYRTTAVNKALLTHFQAPRNYVEFLGDFLTKCANQFALARILGIGHRTVSPSNLSFDGKWLDVPQSSFVGGGVNFIAFKPIYEEALVAAEIVEQLVYTFSKFNQTYLNSEPLISYYIEQLDAYYSFYLSILLSLPEDSLFCSEDKDWELLVNAYALVLVLENSTDIVLFQQADYRKSPALNFVIFQFMTQLNSEASFEYGENKLRFERALVEKLTVAFHSILIKLHKKHKSELPFGNFKVSCEIKAIKKSSQLDFFNLKNGVEEGVASLCECVNTSDIKAYIELYKRVAKWIFQDENSNGVTLFNDEGLCITYSEVSNNFSVKSRGKTKIFDNLGAFLGYIDSMHESMLTINTYFFKPSIMNLAFLMLVEE